MKRRDFLLNGLAAAAGSVIAPATVSTQTAGGGKRVLIIGAGLSGLSAGYELDKLGFDVKILEGQHRIGGRVLTLREFGEELHAEAGAARIPVDHDLTHRYIREFNLKLSPFYPTDGTFVRVWARMVDQVGWDKFADATGIVMSLGKPSVWQKIQGGNDQLPKAFASRLSRKISTGTKVVRIRHSNQGVSATFQNANGTGIAEGDFLIVAVPFTMLRKIEIEPPISALRSNLIRNMEYDSASRVFIETKRRFWRDKGLNGFAFGEDAAEVWDSTFGQSGSHGILQSYLRGAFSTVLTQMPEQRRIADTVEKLSKLFPETPENVIKGISKCWSEDPWTEGAWAHADPKSVAVFKLPEGRLFFAGEHLSSHGSWMQGAIESGLSAVEQIRSFQPQAAAIS